MICECDRHDCSIHEPKLIENFFLHRVHFQHSFSLYELSEYFESQPPHRHCVFEKSINKFVCIRSCNLSGDSEIFKTSLIPNTILLILTVPKDDQRSRRRSRRRFPSPNPNVNISPAPVRLMHFLQQFFNVPGV